MKYLVLTGALALYSSQALAGAPATKVPEMSVGAGVAAIALLVGIAAIIRERMKRK